MKIIPFVLVYQKDIWRILYTTRDSKISQEAKKGLKVKEEKEVIKGSGKGKKLRIAERKEDSLQHTMTNNNKRMRKDTIELSPEISSPAVASVPVPALVNSPVVDPTPLPTTADEEEGTDTASMTSSTMIEIGLIKPSTESTNIPPPPPLAPTTVNASGGSDVWKIDVSTPGLLDKFNLSF
jgi:hypothetical protein